MIAWNHRVLLLLVCRGVHGRLGDCEVSMCLQNRLKSSSSHRCADSWCEVLVLIRCAWFPLNVGLWVRAKHLCFGHVGPVQQFFWALQRLLQVPVGEFAGTSTPVNAGRCLELVNERHTSRFSWNGLVSLPATTAASRFSSLAQLNAPDQQKLPKPSAFIETLTPAD